MAIWVRRNQELEGLVHHSDRGVQYLAIRYTERLAEAGAVRSVGSRGDSYDNALADHPAAHLEQSSKQRTVRRGPCRQSTSTSRTCMTPLRTTATSRSLPVAESVRREVCAGPARVPRWTGGNLGIVRPALDDLVADHPRPGSGGPIDVPRARLRRGRARPTPARPRCAPATPERSAKRDARGRRRPRGSGPAFATHQGETTRPPIAAPRPCLRARAHEGERGGVGVEAAAGGSVGRHPQAHHPVGHRRADQPGWPGLVEPGGRDPAHRALCQAAHTERGPATRRPCWRS